MKSNKIKKIVKQTIEEIHDRDRPMKSVMYTGDWGKYDSEVSDKVKTMVLNLANYRNNINISINLIYVLPNISRCSASFRPKLGTGTCPTAPA